MQQGSCPLCWAGHATCEMAHCFLLEAPCLGGAQRIWQLPTVPSGWNQTLVGWCFVLIYISTNPSFTEQGKTHFLKVPCREETLRTWLDKLHTQSWHVNDYTYIFLGPCSIVPILRIEEKRDLYEMTHGSVKKLSLKLRGDIFQAFYSFFLQDSYKACWYQEYTLNSVATLSTEHF